MSNEQEATTTTALASIQAMAIAGMVVIGPLLILALLRPEWVRIAIWSALAWLVVTGMGALIQIREEKKD